MLPKPISQTSNNQLLILGWYQIIGGAIGLKKTFDLLWSPGYHSGSMITMCWIAMGLYCFSTYAGLLVLSRNYEKGLALTFVNQMLQVFTITLFGFGFMYSSGLMFKVYAFYSSSYGSYSHSEGFNFTYLSNWYMRWGFSNTYEFGVNFVAVYLSYFSYRLYKQVRMERIYIESDYAVEA